MTWRRTGIALGLIAAGGVLAGSSIASADGTETLGDPSTTIADGTGIAVGGTGLLSGSGSISVDIPAGATVEQALLYFEIGHRTSSALPIDASIELNGAVVPGCELIGGPTAFYGDVETSSYRCDITSLGLVGPGKPAISVAGLQPSDINDGAGILAIYDDGGPDHDISVLDGNDIAFVDFKDLLRSTVPQTFEFAAATVDRTADLALMVGSIANRQDDGGAPRPSLLKVTVDGVTTETWDPFGTPGGDGPQFDTGLFDVEIPAGATSVTVEVASEWGQDGLPASLIWVSAALGLEAPAPLPTTTTTSTTVPVNGALDSSAGPPPTIVIPTTPSSQVLPNSVTVPVVNARQLPVTGVDTAGRAIIGAAVAAAGVSLLAASRKRETLRTLPVQH